MSLLCAIASTENIQCVGACSNCKWLFLGDSAGVVSKFDFFASINGSKRHHPKARSCASCSCDGILLSSWGTEDDGATHKHSGVYSLAVHSEAIWLVAGTWDGCVDLYSCRIDEGSRVYRQKVHQSAVRDLHLSSDERWCISSGSDAFFAITSLDTGAVFSFRSLHSAQISSSDFHREKSMLVSTSLDGTASVCQIRGTTIEPVACLSPPDNTEWMLSAKWGKTDNIIYTSNRASTCYEWDLRNTSKSSRTLKLYTDDTPITAILPFRDYILLGNTSDITVVKMSEDWSKKQVHHSLSGHQRGWISQFISGADDQFAFATCGTKGLGGTTEVSQCLIFDVSSLSA